MTLFLVLSAFAVAALTAVAVDRLGERRGLLPPGFAPPTPAWLLRRALASAALTLVLGLGVFVPLALAGRTEPPDLSQVAPAELFLFHGVMVAMLLFWYALGFLALGRPAPAVGEGVAALDASPTVPMTEPTAEPMAPPKRPPPRSLSAQLGLVVPRSPAAPAVAGWLREAGIGGVAGVAGWLSVLLVMAAVVGLFSLFGGRDALPTQAPELVAWMAALPVAVRIAVSLSAGVVEEAFFRGFLQPRCGILLSTLLFVIAHAGYQQPFMLVGLSFLSLLLALLTRWRQNIWPAIIAHALFDLIQLLVVIPLALDYLPAPAEAAVTPALAVSLVCC